MASNNKNHLNKLAEKVIESSFWLNAHPKKPGAVIEKLKQLPRFSRMAQLRAKHFDHWQK